MGAEIEEIGRSLQPSQLTGRDIVHADLHPGNMLQTAGRLSAVVDLDYTRAGDANLVLRLLDWPIRKGRTAEVEFWLSHADRLRDPA